MISGLLLAAAADADDAAVRAVLARVALARPRQR
jgi:hypothetical protein